MKKLFLLFALLPCVLIAQEPDSTQIVYDFVEIVPEYPGGPSEMGRWIAENITYPEDAKENGEEGVVYVKFIIGDDGVLRDITIARGVSESLNNECLRLIAAMPKWSPGYQDGKPVNVSFTLPIKFSL